MTDTKPYREDNPDFVPDPTDQFGTLDTSDTAGAAHSDLNAVSPIFDVAAREGAIQAARALDPEDTKVSPSLVILPGDDGVDRETALANIKKQAAEAEKTKAGDILANRTTEAQAEAAETGGDSTKSTESATAGPQANTDPKTTTPVTTGDSTTGDSTTGAPKATTPAAKKAASTPSK